MPGFLSFEDQGAFPRRGWPLLPSSLFKIVKELAVDFFFLCAQFYHQPLPFLAEGGTAIFALFFFSPLTGKI